MIKVLDIKAHKGRQEIMLPAEMHINDDKVYIKKVGETLYVIPFHNPWQNLIDGAKSFTPDFLNVRTQSVLETRENLD
jgi:antitoxin VapB